MNDRLLTDRDIIEKQCQYCHYLYLNRCQYGIRSKEPAPVLVIDNCGVFQEEIKPKYDKYTEQSIKAVIGEIEKLSCDSDNCVYAREEKCLYNRQERRATKYCKWWQSLKEKYGVE